MTAQVSPSDTPAPVAVPTSANAGVGGEWERLWGLVAQNPDDFASWEALLKLAEAAYNAPGADRNDSATNLRMVFDHFLGKFPLCFGYWKKYADFEITTGDDGKDRAEVVYERAVASIHNSVDFWSHYVQFKKDKDPSDIESIRAVFERAAAAVGYDFLSHTFWDKYIEFEEFHKNDAHVVAILERIIHIPLHQYARYFEKYSQMSATRPIAELISEEERIAFETDIKSKTPSLTLEEVENELRQRIYTLKSAIYMSTQDAVHKRWVYEAEIKRPYFHIKPLDNTQLSNWRKYLDFEEAQGADNIARVYSLYERCLVPCALYEEFWMRYCSFLVGKNDIDGARNVYTRASALYVPAGRTDLRLNFAAFEESQGRIAEARAIYEALLEKVPGHAETIYKFAHFERRQGSIEKGEEILTNGIDAAVDDKSKAYLVAVCAKYYHMIKGNEEATRELYVKHASALSASKYLLMNYFMFELNLPGMLTAENIKPVWSLIKKSDAFTIDEKLTLGVRYSDFLIERTNDISVATKLNQELIEEFTGSAATAAAEQSKKRASSSTSTSAEDDDDVLRAAKSAKLDASINPSTPVSLSAVPPVAAPYAGYAPQAAATWGTAAYGAYAQQWDYTQPQAF